MKRLIQLNLLLLLITPATAQETPAQNPPKVLRTYEWKDLNVQSPNTNCQIQIVSMDGMSVLKIESTIENTNDTALEISLLTITNSSLIRKANTIEWEMKYENVHGLLNVSYFRVPQLGAFFTWFEKFPPQVIGGDGYTDRQGFYLNGKENWNKNDILIRRASYDGQTLPDELRVKLFLPIGTIYLRPIKLLGTAESLKWWSPQQIGLIGGIGGSVIGCFGALLGLLASKGKARTFVLTTMKIFIVLGILLTIAGFVAVVSSQPYAVWYALLLPGVILTLVFSLTLPSIQRRYDELEIRRMTSVDAMGS
jgi:hypothetical protein